MTNTVLAQLTALKTAPAPVLKAKWRELFDREPPPYNRRFLESRLAYRIQELAYGGLTPATLERLEALGEQLERRPQQGLFAGEVTWTAEPAAGERERHRRALVTS